ncbi:DNA polymerase domain-containing protein [Insulibacter thermoxylanivorax]|uniref:DNA polymerase domain-containing protein n=1 Tax=Insulibacter thermoxylanivorax TaxID=2749268 RepID=A0A916VF79_9BACL|nr:non-homologous end-joining DNA ligase [Insulibacter thermoxylanivorax]GFR37086.1 DNA polymerase domain-containing protein [Insulibacter thermoxylanivorax]
MPAVQGTVVIDGYEITITNPDKPLWPDIGLTKLQYLERLITLSPYLLTYLRNRCLTTIRWPHGVGDTFFYQKNAPVPTPEYVRTEVLHGIRYVVADNLPTLIWLGNLACLEFHPSLHLIGSNQPVEWLIDIDPSREYEPRIGQAAAIVGELLQTIGIQSVPKTSGATGVQIYVPIKAGYTFEQLRSIGRFLGIYLTQRYPDLFTLERLKKNRGDRIYFDYLQHWYGKTLSAPYTPRARPGAPVSTPLTWEECRLLTNPAEYNLLNIGERLARLGDLIQQVPPQDLDHALAFIADARI